MFSFKKFLYEIYLAESLALERIHRRPSVAAIKNITKETYQKLEHDDENPHAEINDKVHGKFSVSGSGQVHFGSANYFTHHDLNTAAGGRGGMQGYTFYHPKTGYEYDAYDGKKGQWGGRGVDAGHPFVKQLTDAGFKLREKYKSY